MTDNYIERDVPTTLIKSISYHSDKTNQPNVLL